jgi:hypothetical protein
VVITHVEKENAAMQLSASARIWDPEFTAARSPFGADRQLRNCWHPRNGVFRFQCPGDSRRYASVRLKAQARNRIEF